MNIAWCLQQVPFEGPSRFRVGLENRGYVVKQTVVPSEGLPQGQVDFLLVMGGPMSVNDRDPWIQEELRFVERMLTNDIPVLGICFGAQLLAKVLGGKVDSGPRFEIGMVPVTPTYAGKSDPIFRGLPDSFPVFQWHGEGITLGSQGISLAESADFPVQAFRFKDRVYGLLFHPEIELSGIRTMSRNCPQDVERGGVSSEIIEQETAGHLPFLHEFADRVIGHLAGLSPRTS